MVCASVGVGVGVGVGASVGAALVVGASDVVGAAVVVSPDAPEPESSGASVVDGSVVGGGTPVLALALVLFMPVPLAPSPNASAVSACAHTVCTYAASPAAIITSQGSCGLRRGRAIAVAIACGVEAELQQLSGRPEGYYAGPFIHAPGGNAGPGLRTGVSIVAAACWPLRAIANAATCNDFAGAGSCHAPVRFFKYE